MDGTRGTPGRHELKSGVIITKFQCPDILLFHVWTKYIINDMIIFTDKPQVNLICSIKDGKTV